MIKDQDTYTAFMLDYVAGTQSEEIALAGDFHLLLSDAAIVMTEIWEDVAAEMGKAGGHTIANRNMDLACSMLDSGLSQISWKRSLFGGWRGKSGLENGQFIKLEPGKSLPTHGHKKLEVTVVLEGQFSDGNDVFQPGDIVFGLPGHRHKPASYGSAPCICYLARAPI